MDPPRWKCLPYKMVDFLKSIIDAIGSTKSTDYSNPDDLGRILNKNKDKNFVQRILTPDTNPVLMNYAGPNTYGTHLMASGEYGGKGIVYPEIIQALDGSLKRLDSREAGDHAIKSGEYIEFNTPEEAEAFGKNYKRVWGGEFNK